MRKMNFKIWLLAVVMLLGAGSVWGTEGDLIYTLDLAAQSSAFGTSNTYGAKSGTVSGVTWYANAASCQSTSAVWLGTNSATNRTNLTILSSGVNNRGGAIATALSITTSDVGYYAIVAGNSISNVGSIKVKAATTGGTAPATIWCLYTTDGGTSYTVLGSKTSPGTNEQTFTPSSTIASAQYAFVFYSNAFGTFRTPYFRFYEGASLSCTTPTTSFATPTSVSKFTDDDPFTNAFTTNNTSTKVWSSTNEAAATVDQNGEVTIVGAGSTDIRVNQVADATYCAVVNASYTLTVSSPTVPEPTNHATAFAATANTSSQITVTWTDATDGQVPDGYLVKASTGTPTAPVDGTAEADAALVKNIAQGTQTAVFTGLTASTTYNFSIWPYTNSGTAIDYKTGSEPTANATTSAPVVATYTWNVSSGNWNTASSWSPARTTPDVNDILIFDGNIQANPTITLDFSSPHSVGKMRIINNANVVFGTSSTTRTLNIGYAGASSPQLEISSGSNFTVSAASAVTINVLSGFTGSISGNVTFQNAAHLLKAADAGGINFNSGSIFTAGTGFTGNAFGTATPYNAIVFASGSTYIAQAGSNPFGASQPNSVVVFQSGSTFKQKLNSAPSMNGRTYANFEVDNVSFSQNFTGAAGVTLDNLILTNSTLANFNFAGTVNIKGNVIINSGTLTLNGNVNFNGSSTQTISGLSIIPIVANANFVVDNDVIVDRNITIDGAMTINATKTLSVNAGKQLNINTTLTNNGTLNLKSDATGTATLTGTTSGTGTYNIEQYLSSARNWYISTPIDGATSPFNSINRYFEYVQAGNHTVSTDPVIPGETTYWKGYAASFSLVKGKGYIAQVSAPTTITFSGAALNNADVTVDLFKTDGATKAGFNLIGNPFPAYLNVRSAIQANANLTKTLWYRTRTTGASPLYKYETVNTASGEGSNIAGAASVVTGYIPPMQAFWVKTSANTTMTLSKAACRHAMTSGDTLTTPLKAPSLIKRLRLKVSNPLTADETLIYFNENANNGLDDYDSPKMFENSASVPEIYTSEGAENLALNGKNSYDYGTSIPLGLKIGETNTYTIAASQVQNFDEDTKIVLVDNNTSTQTDLTAGETYTFTSDATTSTSRFSVLFKSASGTTGVNNTNNNSTVYIDENNRILVDYFNVHADNASVSVYNGVGQKLHSQKLTGNKTIINKSFTTGVYVVKVSNSAGEITNKIVVQ